MAFGGKEGINLLVHAYHFISLFSFIIFNFSFLFLLFSQCLLLCCDSLLEVTITMIVIPPPSTVHDKGLLYNAYHD